MFNSILLLNYQKIFSLYSFSKGQNDETQYIFWRKVIFQYGTNNNILVTNWCISEW